jgi:putative N6-adenine-specific DNA methylase
VKAARFFATAAKGTEPLLRDELIELGLPAVRADRGGVHFGQERAHAYRACLWSRIALRVLEPAADFECASEEALYAGVRSIDWGRVLDARHTLAVRASCRSSRLTHTQYIAQHTKDAIVDQLRARTGARPSVDRSSPDVSVFVHLVRDHATVYLDYAGGSLHEHGFRERQGAAPLKETLAAALVRYSGWDGTTPFVDPMCGSGTLLIEAGLWAARRAPGLSRERFGFERWADFDATAQNLLSEQREAARAAAQPLVLRLVGFDIDAEALAAARANARRAGVKVILNAQPIARLSPESAGAASGALVTNPPYGQRLEQDRELAQELARLMRRFEGWRRALILPRNFGLSIRPSAFLHVHNGALECEFRRYDPDLSRASET